MSKRAPLDEIREVLLSDAASPAKAERIADHIRRSGNYRWVGIYEVNGGEIAILGWSGAGVPAHPRFPVAQGLCGAAVASRNTVIAGDVTRDPRYLTTFGSTRSEMVVPVFGPAGRGVVAVIDVESERVDAFTDEDRDFGERCASAIAGLW
ncbi:MAG: GAF domain-containing protein [Acidobacteriia bacterium]|nr:GAF domain-containing protein [Terriglobia bacterium]